MTSEALLWVLGVLSVVILAALFIGAILVEKEEPAKTDQSK
jgi:hypothetical protein